jgi:hypothetical protein
MSSCRGSSRGMKWNNGTGGGEKVCHGRGVKQQRPDNERSVSADRSCVGWLPFLETRLHRCALTSSEQKRKSTALYSPESVLVMTEFYKSSGPSVPAGIVFLKTFVAHLHVKSFRGDWGMFDLVTR